MHPHWCTTFEEHYPEGCQGCVHKGKYKSPISLCIEVKEATPEENIVDKQGNIVVADPNINLLTPAKSQYTVPDYPGNFF